MKVLPSLTIHYENPRNQTESLCNTLFGHVSLSKTSVGHGLWALGRVMVKELEQVVAEQLGVATAPVFYRLLKRSKIFYSKNYKRTKKRNSYTVMYRDGFGQVLYFINLTDKTIAVVQKLDISLDVRFVLHKSTLYASSTTTITLVPVEHLLEKCVFMGINAAEQYIARIPSHIVMD